MASALRNLETTPISAVVDAAQRGEPQWVTRRGKPVSVLLTAEMFER
jgi:prevent-host-death family protein